MLKKMHLLEAIKPKPMPFELISIGNGKDGTYLIPNDLVGIDACYSPGVNNYKYFEDYLAINFGIKSHMCDFTSDLESFSTPLIEGFQTFEKKWLDVNNSSDSISLSEWVDKYSPNSDGDLILQIDIEGAEFRNLNNASDLLLKRFRIIVIEIHGFSRLLSNEPNEVQDLIAKLSEFFDVVHATANNCCGEVFFQDFEINLPNLIEMTFLRKDRILNAQGDLYYPVLPSQFDIINTNQRPIYLNKNWLFNDKCKLDNSIIERELNKFDAKFYKHQFELLSIALGNFNDHFSRISKLDSRLINLNVDLAADKPFILDTGERGFVSSKLPYFFHSSATPIPSITIDLLQEFEIAELRILNRSDTGFDRADSLAYVVHSEPVYDIYQIVPITSSDDFINGKDFNFTVIPLLKGRYLTVLSFKSEPLHFSSLNVYAVKN